MRQIRNVAFSNWPALAIAAMFATVIVFSTEGEPGPEIYGLALLASDDGESELPPPDAARVATARDEVSLNTPPGWLQAYFDSDADLSALNPPALELAGPFSATVYLNRQLVGYKGGPSDTLAEEQAGPIDAVIPLPGVRAGRNELLLYISAHHAWPGGWTMLNDFRVLPGIRANQRTPAFYTVAIGSLGLLAILAVFYGRRAIHPAGPAAIRWVFAGLVFLLIALLAEICRAWVNYPYPFHPFRMAVLSAATLAAGYCVARSVSARLALSRWPLGLLVTLLIIFAFFPWPPNADFVTLAGLAVCALNIAHSQFSAARNGLRRTPLTLALFATVLFALAQPWAWLNNGVFATLAVLLVANVPISFLSREPARLGADASSRLSFAAGGQCVSLAHDDIMLARSAGNYVELVCRDRSVITLRATLGEIAANLPSAFLRLHRRYVVNMQYARKVTRTRSGRYMLAIDHGEAVPVSRATVPAVRNWIEHGAAPPLAETS